LAAAFVLPSDAVIAFFRGFAMPAASVIDTALRGRWHLSTVATPPIAAAQTNMLNAETELMALT
jgi:hypothetical protein